MNSLRTLKPYLRRHLPVLILGIILVLLANATAMAVPILVGEVINLIESRSISRATLESFAIGIVCLAGVAGCFRFLMRRILIDLSRDIEYEFRNEIFGKLQKLDPTFFDRNNTGDLMSRCTNDMDSLRMLIGPGVMYSANTIFGVPIAVGGMMLLNWKLALIAMIPMLGLPPLVKYFGARMHKIARMQQDAFGDLTTVVQENLAGIRVVKAYTEEQHQLEKFARKNDVYIDKSLQLAKLQSYFFPSIRFLVAAGYVLLLMVGGHQIMNNGMQVGTLVSFIVLFSMLIWPLVAAGWVVNVIQRGLASMDRINMILEAEPLVTEPKVPSTVSASPSISINDLTFRYPGTQRDQLSHINLNVPPGKTIGILGPVGSGKSTLVNLLAKLYPVERGQILLGGQDINDIPSRELRRRIAFVFQETFLFSDTIGWNIRFGREDEVEQSAVEHAAEVAQLHSSVIEFPKGYDTVLGERGVNLSGGQKQRTALARAIIKDADILILDDSLSAVDTHTEEAILSALREIMREKTTFLISHRISTLSLADEIIVLEEGQITERGNLEELVKLGGHFADIYKRQLSERAVEDYEEEPAQ